LGISGVEDIVESEAKEDVPAAADGEVIGAAEAALPLALAASQGFGGEGILRMKD
jgi:hypothetical protein